MKQEQNSSRQTQQQHGQNSASQYRWIDGSSRIHNESQYPARQNSQD